tara:strand:+ start:16977 stop:17594 length:618 start_codon:yes stop_codon:yes gene_type:complete
MHIISKALIMGCLFIAPLNSAFAKDMREAPYESCREEKHSEPYCQCLSGKSLDLYIERFKRSKLNKKLKQVQDSYQTSKKRLLNDLSRSEPWLNEYCDLADKLTEEYNEIATVPSGEKMTPEQHIKTGAKRQELDAIFFQKLKEVDPNHRNKVALNFHYGTCQGRRDIKKAQAKLSDLQASIDDGSIHIGHIHLRRIAQMECQGL